MYLVADANALIGGVFRAEGQRMLRHPALDLFAAEHVWAEVRHELPRRGERLALSRGIAAEVMALLVTRSLASIEDTVFVVPREAYAVFEEPARRRVDRDPEDWPTIAVAMLTNGAIWTEDRDFFGCGLATWRGAVLGAVLPTLGEPV
jgi:predicted nucleic acid-binding protein